jgi:ferritin
VVFTSYERWMQRAASGEYEHPKSMLEYMTDLKKIIGQRIEDDPSGDFDII